eukprot:m.1386800 g.1386800  ORF g.1386800 m.1386800 type:complete len:307 (+) comp24977_c0_seq6:4220-5140(+)
MDFTQLEDASKSGAVQYSQQTDIYSFGVIMWETVYNGLPFDAALEKCHSHEDRVGGILKTIINGGVHRFWNDCGKNDNDKKRSCPATFEEKMHDCLFHKAERRPAFNQLCADLENSQTWQIPFECVDFKLDGEQKRVALAKSANGLAFIGGLTLPGRGNRIEVVLREFSAVKFTNVSACVTKPKARHEPQAVEVCVGVEQSMRQIRTLCFLPFSACAFERHAFRDGDMIRQLKYPCVSYTCLAQTCVPGQRSSTCMHLLHTPRQLRRRLCEEFYFFICSIGQETCIVLMIHPLVVFTRQRCRARGE